MRQWRFALFLLLLPAALTACSIVNFFDQDAPSPIDTELEETLSHFPLYEGAEWVYDYWAYSEGQEATWQVVKKVTETRMMDNDIYAVKVQPSITLTGDAPEVNFVIPPSSESFWYLVGGAYIYQVDTVDPEPDLAKAMLELILPLSDAGEGWYPDPYQRTAQADSEIRLPGFRYVYQPYEKDWGTDGTRLTCYDLLTPYNNGYVEQTFCDGVGFVFDKFDHAGTPFGYEINLVEANFPEQGY